MSEVNGMNIILAIIIAGLMIAGAVMLAGNNVAVSISALQLKAVAAGANAGDGGAAAGAATGATGGTGAAGGATTQPTADFSFTGALPTLGSTNAKVSVLIFEDFQCPYCAIYEGNEIGGAQYDAIRGVSGKIRTDYIDAGKSVKLTPVILSFLGEESVRAAEAAFCADDQGKFWQYHDYAFGKHTGHENAGTLSDANLKQFAVDLGLDTAAFNACFDAGKYADKVAQITTDASDKAGVSSTPTIFVNGKQVSPEYASVKAAIDAALAK